jgi:predicted glycosyltransferase involved in capsule biosynthesis
MQNLKNTTFIIPLCIESQDRLNNAKTVLGYLNHHFNTNVIIHELSNNKTKLPFLENYKNITIEHILEISDMSTYHRTRQLNEMLNIVKTKVVVNYDIDVLLPINTYVKASDMILNDTSDVVYPYGDGIYQKRVFTSFKRNKFDFDFDLSYINNGDYDMWNAKHGHCIFLNSEKYKSCGGENENFIAYGPEDTERFERFFKIGYKIDRINDYVYHLEHYRTPFSNNNNKYFLQNNLLYQELSRMNKDEIINYYKDASYKDKYKNF